MIVCIKLLCLKIQLIIYNYINIIFFLSSPTNHNNKNMINFIQLTAH